MNIRYWKIKNLDNFTITLKKIRPPKCENPKIINLKTNELQIDFPGGYVKGKRDKNSIIVSDIKCINDSSQVGYKAILEPAFKTSKGDLELVIGWGRFEKIESIKVHNGIIKRENIVL